MGLQPTNRERETGNVDPFALAAATDPAVLNEGAQPLLPEHGAGSVTIRRTADDPAFDPTSDVLRRPDVTVTDELSPGPRGYVLTNEQRERLEAEAERRGCDLIDLLRGDA